MYLTETWDKKPRENKRMRPLLSKPAQSQLFLSALFVAALSFISLAASFAEVPADVTVASNE